MKSIKYLVRTALALLCLALPYACSNDDTEGSSPSAPSLPGTKYAFVVNQGNMYNGLPGSLSRLNLSDGTVTADFFYSFNHRALGDTPQRPVRYGSRIYVPVYGSSLVWVIDAATTRIIASLSVSNPEAVCGAGGYVYIASNDGYVQRADTLGYTLSDRLTVGPNPMGLATLGDKVYATISDSYNYTGANAYANGKKLAVIDTQTFTKSSEIPVGTNPTQIEAGRDGNLYVVASGNFSTIPSTIQRVTPSGTTTDLCTGSLFALRGDTLAVASTTYDANYTPSLSLSYVILSSGRTVADFIAEAERPASAIMLDFNPADGHLFVCANASAAAYNEPGIVHEYAAIGSGAKRIRQYAVGVQPYGLVFQ